MIDLDKTAKEVLTREIAHWTGREIVLWKGEHRARAYQDQFGVQHGAFVVLEEVVVKITETKVNQCTWRQDDAGVGLKGEDSRGVIYTNSWEHFDDCSMSPRAQWWDGQDIWYLAEQYHGLCVRPSGERAVPTGYAWCDRCYTVTPGTECAYHRDRRNYATSTKEVPAP